MHGVKIHRHIDHTFTRPARNVPQNTHRAEGETLREVSSFFKNNNKEATTAAAATKRQDSQNYKEMCEYSAD